MCWNYNCAESSNMNTDIFFYTNNICESFNRTINSKYIGKCKTLEHFKKAVIDLLEMYNVKNCYQEKKLSTSRALAYYINRNTNIKLISAKDLEKIKQSYKEYLKKNKIPYDNSNFESDDEDNYNKILESDNNSDSDNEEEEVNENIHYGSDEDDDDKEGGNDNNNFNNIDNNINFDINDNSSNKNKNHSNNDNKKRSKSGKGNQKKNNNILYLYNNKKVNIINYNNKKNSIFNSCKNEFISKNYSFFQVEGGEKLCSKNYIINKNYIEKSESIPDCFNDKIISCTKEFDITDKFIIKEKDYDLNKIDKIVSECNNNQLLFLFNNKFSSLSLDEKIKNERKNFIFSNRKKNLENKLFNMRKINYKK